MQTLNNEETGEWNSLISQIFLPKGAAIVHSLPISRFVAANKIIWWPSKEMVFLVKSAYHLEMDINWRKEGKTSNRGDAKCCWKAMWKLKVPEPVKHFLWRAYHDLLLTRENLLKRKIIEHASCPICE